MVWPRTVTMSANQTGLFPNKIRSKSNQIEDLRRMFCVKFTGLEHHRLIIRSQIRTPKSNRIFPELGDSREIRLVLTVQSEKTFSVVGTFGEIATFGGYSVCIATLGRFHKLFPGNQKSQFRIPGLKFWHWFHL